MTESQYEQIITTSLSRFRDLYTQREEIDVELAKLRQFLYAALNLVPDSERDKWEVEVEETVSKLTRNATSLAESIRKIYKDRPDTGYTVAGVREMLIEGGFDFSAYKSNPLSSISTTLRRMVETGELDTRTDMEGTTIFIPSQEDEDQPKAARRKKK
jgi:hypothetical protein